MMNMKSSKSKRTRKPERQAKQSTPNCFSSWIDSRFTTFLVCCVLLLAFSTSWKTQGDGRSAHPGATHSSGRGIADVNGIHESMQYQLVVSVAGSVKSGNLTWISSQLKRYDAVIYHTRTKDVAHVVESKKSYLGIDVVNKIVPLGIPPEGLHFLDFLIENYDQLRNVTVFLPAHPWLYSPDIFDLLERPGVWKGLQPLGWGDERGINPPFLFRHPLKGFEGRICEGMNDRSFHYCETAEKCSQDNEDDYEEDNRTVSEDHTASEDIVILNDDDQPEKDPLCTFWREIGLEGECPTTITVNYKNTFAVSEGVIKRHPREYYKMLQSWVMDKPKLHSLALERLWLPIFEHEHRADFALLHAQPHRSPTSHSPPLNKSASSDAAIPSKASEASRSLPTKIPITSFTTKFPTASPTAQLPASPPPLQFTSGSNTTGVVQLPIILVLGWTNSTVTPLAST